MHFTLPLVAALAGAPARPATVPSTGWSPLPPILALAEARAEQKPVLIDFYATWCVPCQEMDRVTFPHPAVRTLLEDYARIKVDAESAEGLELVASFEVFGYPTLVLLSPAGHEIGRMVGYASPDEFVSEASSLIAASRGALDSATAQAGPPPPRPGER
jgi:thiol:disulfide interchange protein